jgi:hypothetical protein
MKDSSPKSNSSSPVLGDFFTHASRTMMLSELSLLLQAAPVDASPDDYRSAVLDENMLLKGAATT